MHPKTMKEAVNSMPEDQEPNVVEGFDLQTGQVLCRHHAEPFLANWPLGYTVFAVEGMQRLSKDREFRIATRGKLELWQPALDKKPICCRLSRKALLELYQYVQDQTKFCTVADCHMCDKVVCETMVCRVLSMPSRVEMNMNVCFECFVFNCRVTGRN